MSQTNTKMNNYPQMPSMATGEIETFLKEPQIATIATHNPDGSIHLAPVWFKYSPETNEILFGTQDISKKIRNLKQNNNVSVQVSIDKMPAKAVLIYGTATLDYEDVIEKRVDIFSNYTSPEMARGFVEHHAQKHKPVVVRIKIDIRCRLANTDCPMIEKAPGSLIADNYKALSGITIIPGGSLIQLSKIILASHKQK